MGRSALRQTKAQGRVEWRWRRLIAASRPMSSGDEEVGLVSEWFSYIEPFALGNNKIALCDCQVKRLNKS